MSTNSRFGVRNLVRSSQYAYFSNYCIKTCFKNATQTPNAEGLVEPKVLAKNVTDFGYPRACRIRKISNYGSSLYQLFSKRDLTS
jgi:hypothetical protein